jgi:hypothetical protein
MYWNLLGVGRSYFDIFSNTCKVVNTIGSEKEHFGASKELKILKAVELFGLGNINGTKCLRNLKESWFRPPPGGAHTGIRVVSYTCLKKSLCLS